METPSVEDLMQRCTALLADITAFQAHFAGRKSVHVDIKHFKGLVASEEKTLQRLAIADPSTTKTIHNLRSSNLPFYEAVWRVSRASRGVLGMHKKFYWEQLRGRSKKPKKKSALVDVIAEDGLEWVKISTISENKLLFEKAKAGWEAEEYQSNDDDMPAKIYPEGVEPPADLSDEDDDEICGRIELVKIAQDLQKASRATRAHFRHPAIRIVLPNLSEGDSDVVDGILAELRATGATVECGSQAAKEENPFERMTPPVQQPMTPTANLDCTILLALISDLSHQKPDDLDIPKKPHPSLNHQVEVERSCPLLPHTLWPAIKGVERLVTSRRSVTRMWEIVHTIGTSSERARAQAFFPENAEAGGLRQTLQANSIYDVPELPLPVEVIESVNTNTEVAPQSVLAAVASGLSDINRSVFMLGWMNGWTTVTSNRAAVKTIEGILTKELDKLQANGQDDTITEPRIWTIDVARSLVGKESGRAV